MPLVSTTLKKEKQLLPTPRLPSSVAVLLRRVDRRAGIAEEQFFTTDGYRWTRIRIDNVISLNRIGIRFGSVLAPEALHAALVCVSRTAGLGSRAFICVYLRTSAVNPFFFATVWILAEVRDVVAYHGAEQGEIQHGL